MNSRVKVSVCVVTYNHQKYIAECLQSLVDQDTDFPFEVIVSDDCSTDNTRSIISSFHSKYPDIIRPIFREVNLGGGDNYIQTHSEATGKYVAHMDGDDYALPGKLQTQVDYLEANIECNIVWTPIFYETRNGVLNEQNATFKSYFLGKRMKRPDLIFFGTVGANSSIMYRNTGLGFSKLDFPIMDYLINVQHVGLGYATFAGDKPLGVYRVGIGVASVGNKTRRIFAKSLLHILKEYPEYRLEINSVALVNLLADLKNRRSSFFDFFKIYIKTFKIGSMIKVYKVYKYIKSANYK